ncbi:GNAT family N-acetyltransferase [Algicella marina]|uniref:GNAT family N-acetyltransferase n=1 Tax=Algicella marina TaxID=2683284 RepID=A0A6P1T161_9RHOB|nr:GNAT family N-acetyltransferase [Algicella marina]QHQ35495.1 GNAT family N-acetyltransferase [Algicella marina]
MTERTVSIRAFEPEDIDAITAILNLPGTLSGTMQFPFRSVAERAERLTGYRPELYLVVEKCGGVVGFLTLDRYKGRRGHCAGLGLSVHDDHIGQGVGSALMGAGLDSADNWLGIHRLELDVFVDNTRAVALYERFGFDGEGVARARGLRAGRYVDTLSMARLRPGCPPAAMRN